MTHISISNKKGTVRYIEDITAMTKTELPAKIMYYIMAMPNIKRIALYIDQLEWINKVAGKKGMTHSVIEHNTYQQIAREVLLRAEIQCIELFSINREA